MDWKPRLAIISDEASDSFAEAVSICLPLGIRAYELRKLGSGRFPEVTDEAIASVLKTVKASELTIIGVSPGFFKHKLADPQTDMTLKTGFPAIFRLMERLGVRRMTIFSFKREAKPASPIPDGVIDRLQQASELCQHEGIQMLIENSASCWGNTGKNLGYLAQKLGVKVTWDPGNAAASGEIAYPDGYQAVRDHIAHVHFKNWTPKEGSVAIKEGIVDMVGQVAELKADNYPGYYCVEPHQWHHRKSAVRLNTRQLLGLLEDTSQ